MSVRILLSELGIDVGCTSEVGFGWTQLDFGNAHLGVGVPYALAKSRPGDRVAVERPMASLRSCSLYVWWFGG
jgi:hypothetical protein